MVWGKMVIGYSLAISSYGPAGNVSKTLCILQLLGLCEEHHALIMNKSMLQSAFEWGIIREIRIVWCKKLKMLLLLQSQVVTIMFEVN